MNIHFIIKHTIFTTLHIIAENKSAKEYLNIPSFSIN